MARAHTIWLVVSDRLGPLKAFTVKHELKTWLDKQPGYMKIFWSIWSLPDGEGGYPPPGRSAEFRMRADKW